MTVIEQDLDRIEEILTTLLNEPTMRQLLADCGYGSEQLQQGFALYEKARALSHVREESRQTKTSVAKEFAQAWKIARLHYTLDLRLARLASQRAVALRSILPRKRRSKRKPLFSDWHHEAQTFYSNLQKSTAQQAVLAHYGLTAVRIADSVIVLQKADEAYGQQFKQAAQAQAMLRDRDNTLQFLRHWMRILRVVMRTAFQNRPDFLLTVGLRNPPEEWEL